MKRSIFKTLTALAIATLCLGGGLLLGSCKKGDTPDSSSGVTVGGENTAPETSYEIRVQETLHLSVTVKEYDFSKLATVVGNDGVEEYASVAENSVVLGTKGEYAVKYVYEGVSKEMKVLVYDEPTLTFVGTEQDITLAYDELQTGIYEGLAASDCFGNPLSISLDMSKTSTLYLDGVAQYGQHEVYYSVLDKAGNVASLHRKITVNPLQNAPTVAVGVCVDVADSTLVFPADLKGERVSLFLINGKQIAYRAGEAGLELDCEEIFDVSASGTVDVCLVTNAGYAEGTIQILDEKDPEINYYGADNWVYLQNTADRLPVVSKMHTHQKYEIEYVLKSPSGSVIATENNSFTPDTVGTYTYEITPVKEGSRIERLTRALKLHVYAKADYDGIVASCDSLQNLSSLSLTPDSKNYLAKGISVDYGYSEDVGVGAYKYRSDRGGNWQGYILARDIDVTQYDRLAFDYYFDDSENPLDPSQKTMYPSVVVGDKKMMIAGYTDWSTYNLETGEGCYGNRWEHMSVRKINADGSVGALVNPKMNGKEGKAQWLRVEVSLEPYKTSSTREVKLISEYFGKFYVKNVRLLKGALSEKTTLATNADISGDTNLYNSGRYTYETTEIDGRNVQKLTINSMNATNFYQNGLTFGLIDEWNTDSMALEYNKVVFDLYASDNANVEMALGYYYKGTTAGDKTNGGFHQVRFTDSMSAEDRARVRFYNMDGEEIYFKTGEWIRVEFSIDDYKTRTAEEYFRVVIGSAVIGSSIAVDNAYFDKAALAESTLGENPKWSTNVSISSDTDYYNSGRYTYETAEVDGRSVQKLTINSMSADNFFQNGLTFGAVNGNTDPKALEYSKVVFDLYASHNSNVEMALGYYYKGAYAGDKTNGGMYKVRFSGILSTEDQARVRFYNMQGEEIRYTTGEWIRVEFSLDDYKTRTAEEYLKIMIGSAVVGSSIAVDNAYFDKAALAESTLTGGFTENASFRLSNDMAATDYTYEATEIGGRSAQQLTVTTMKPGYEGLQQNGLMFGTRDDNNTDEKYLAYNKFVLEIYVAEGSDVRIALGHYDGSFHPVTLTESLSAEDQARVRFYDMQGEATDFKTGEWIRVEFSLDDYKNATSKSYFRILVGTTKNGSSFAIGRSYFSSDALYETKKGQAFTIEEERQIVEFCKRNPQYKGNSAILLMLYTGMRVGERKTVTYDEKYIYCQSEKVHKGKPVKTRKIPISPMLREVLPMINWELAIHTSNFTVRDALKRIFLNRHTHELRYTFITRAKECGINPELVMQWVGHEYYDEVWTSRVNRGYTNYSEGYELKEMEKYRYEGNGDNIFGK